MRRITITVALLVVASAALASTSTAFAESPWWHLTSGSRPTNLESGGGHAETPQEDQLSVKLIEFEAPGQAAFVVHAAGKEFSFGTEPLAGSQTGKELGLKALSQATLQTALEEALGAGEVHVSEKTEGEILSFAITAPAGASITASGLGLEEPSVKVLDPGITARADGEIYVTAMDLGDQSVSGAGTPVKLVDVLPSGLKAVSIVGTKPFREDNFKEREFLSCSLQSLSCTLGPSLAPFEALVPFDQIEMRIGVVVEPGAKSGELNQASISGGEGFVCDRVSPGTGSYSESGCMPDTEAHGDGFERAATGPVAPASLRRPIVVSGEPTPFGLEEYELANEEEGGTPTTQAGKHPFQQTTTITVHQSADSEAGTASEKPQVHPAAPTKDLHINWPPGLIGNPTPIAQCTDAQFFTGNEGVNLCPPQSAIGVAVVTINEPVLARVAEIPVPLFNLVPHYGEPARFGFNVVVGNAPVVIDTSLRSDGDYGVTVSANNITQIADFLSSTVIVWGNPGDPSHNGQRGWACLIESNGAIPLAVSAGGAGSCAASETSEAQHPQPFLLLPTSCGPAPHSTVLGDTWTDPLPVEAFPTLADYAMPALQGCNKVPFTPTMGAQPTTDRASAPSGLDFNLDFHDEGLTNGKGLVQSQLKDTVVTLPEGLTINPSAGVGLGGCTRADYARETVSSEAGVGCPNDSKLGTVEIETPLLAQKIDGSIFIAQPFDNPSNSLVALYVVAKNPETGVLIKLAGKVTPNPVTGQLVTTFENNPQLPFSHFNFHFREGQQAPLISPAACGTYNTTARLAPWSEPTAALTDTSSFTITKGFDGGPCPAGGVPPFHPQIQSGTINNNAGSFSPFYLHLTRTDAEQEISGFSTNLPPGLTGDLTGIPFCSEADIALARTKSGAQEEANPSCPAQSQVGHTLVGTGVGAVLAYVPGKLYLAGPFHGAPFSLVAVTSAVVGPFDLGTVVLRFGLNIDPYTAQVSVSPTSSEPIPTIIDGIVTHVRDIRVYVERPGNAPFTMDPTSCNPMAIGSTLNSSLGASATVTSPFQAANCASLKFAPKFAVSTSGKTSKANGASLHVALTYPSAPQGTYADIAKVKVELPKQLPSRLTTLQKACTAAQFEANPAGCPSPSVIGTAKAVVPNIPEPLAGPVYFVSHGGEAFPSLEIVLQGYGVKVILVGSTFISKAGITSTTFKAVPDNPVSSFELTLPQGKYSALAANGNLCTQKLTMPTEFVGQNGAKVNQSTKLSITGCAKKKTLTRAQKLKATLKACHKQAKGKRAQCEKAARKRFGPVKQAKKRKKK
jgi:hypothetical protein